MHDIRSAIEHLRQGGHDAAVAITRSLAPRIAARADHYDRLGDLPVDSLELLWGAGLMHLTLPVESGGVGADLFTAQRVVGILAAADGSTAFLLKAHLAHLIDGGKRLPAPLREHFLEALSQRPAMQAGSRSDKEGGSAARGGLPRATATLVVLPDGSRGWKLNAHKTFATGSTGAVWLSFYAATAPEDGEVQVGTFIVPAGTPGLEVLEHSWDPLGMRATVSNEIVARDVLIPHDHAVGLVPFKPVDPAEPRAVEFRQLDWTSVMEASVYSGIAEGARDWLVDYLRTRVPASLGRPLATLERLQSVVGEIELLLFENRQLIEDVARRVDLPRAVLERRQLAPATNLETCLVRMAAARNAIRAVDLALTLTGNYGLSHANPLQRFFRDVLCGRVHEPQPDVLLLSSGRRTLRSAAQSAA